MYVKRKVLGLVQRVHPSNLAQSATATARRAGARVADAAREGVAAAQRRERELRAERDGRLVRLSEYLVDGDEVVVDGEPVDSGRVIVLRHRER
jgi:hypothetical protein